jgi:cell division septum initiation protein DivIVA
MPIRENAMIREDAHPSISDLEVAIGETIARRDASLRRAEASQLALKSALSAELTSTQKLLAELDRRHAAAADEILKMTQAERARIIDEARQLAASMMAGASSNPTDSVCITRLPQLSFEDVSADGY